MNGNQSKCSTHTKSDAVCELDADSEKNTCKIGERLEEMCWPYDRLGGDGDHIKDLADLSEVIYCTTRDTTLTQVRCDGTWDAQIENGTLVNLRCT